MEVQLVEMLKCSRRHAHRMLSATNGDMNAAVELHFLSGGEPEELNTTSGGEPQDAPGVLSSSPSCAYALVVLKLSVVDVCDERKTFTVPVENILLDVSKFKDDLLSSAQQMYPAYQLQRSTFQLKHLGSECEPHRDLDFFLLARDEPACFSLCGAATVVHSYLITVRYPWEQETNLVVSRFDTIKILKETIRAKEGIPLEQQLELYQVGKAGDLEDCRTMADYKIQEGSILHLNVRTRDAAVATAPKFQAFRLIRAGKELKDGRALYHYLIKDGDALQLTLRLRGGGGELAMFADVSDSSALTEMHFSDSAPVWRVADEGLCVEGLCKNARCEAYDKMVISNQQFRHFDLILDMASQTTKCPCCEDPFIPITCAFNNCQWMFSGIKLEDGKPVQVKSQDWKTAGNKYERFSDASSNQVTWVRLLLVARPSVKPEECSICYEQIGSDWVQTPSPPCPKPHQFHKECISEWLSVSAACPLCRSTVGAASNCKPAAAAQTSK